jgi:hypothetical protein
VHDLKQQLLRDHPVHDTPLEPQTRRLVASPLARKRFVVKTFDRTLAKRPEITAMSFHFSVRLRISPAD